jgi:hypothetical protein
MDLVTYTIDSKVATRDATPDTIMSTRVSLEPVPPEEAIVHSISDRYQSSSEGKRGSTSELDYMSCLSKPLTIIRLSS